MNNPLLNNMAGSSMGNPMQMLQRLKADPIGTLRQAGYNIPPNLTDPNAIIQHLMNSGQVTQEKYDRARQMLARFR